MKAINTLVVAALMMSGHHLHAQDFNMEYTSELQTDIRNCNFVNLLQLNVEVPLGNRVSLVSSTISIAKTREKRLLDDLQTFSNIEEDNLPLAISMCGMDWEMLSGHHLSVGIRNMDEDYFTSDITSLFTNSSCGIYPTLSANYPIANYPLSSLGIHYIYHKEINGDEEASALVFQASLYNGRGYNRFVGRESVFRCCPRADDVFGLAQVEYMRSGSSYFLSACRRSSGSSVGEECPSGTTLWTYAEQYFSPHLSILAGYSHAFGKDAECTDFVGIGGRYVWPRCELGVFTDYAHFAASDEVATEVTCKITLSSHIYIQPTAHLIITDGDRQAIGMMRFSVKL